jgi:hypothetical protein
MLIDFTLFSYVLGSSGFSIITTYNLTTNVVHFLNLLCELAEQYGLGTKLVTHFL